MIEPLALFLANFIYIALKAFQQKNVMHDNFPLVIPTSFGMAVCEYFIMGTIAVLAINSQSFIHTAINVSSIGLGGGLGSCCAMWYYKRIINNDESVMRSSPVHNLIDRILSKRKDDQ